MNELEAHLMAENERYRAALKRIREAVQSIPLFGSNTDELKAHKKAMEEINEILEETGIF
jgi:hypothetical protein